MHFSATKRASAGPRANHTALWIAISVALALAGVTASALGARATARSGAKESRLSFHLASAEIASTLKLAIQHEEDLIVSASAFVAGDPGASPAGFDRWAESVRAMRRYPELQNIGLVKLVAASQLRAFAARLAADPVRPLGPSSLPPGGPLQILPAGARPYYCFAVAGLARSAASYLPAGVDYCALAPTLYAARNTGLTTYAPVAGSRGSALGIETPVYRGGRTPATAAARRRAFIGWLGELVEPGVVLARALEGHPHVAVRFSYSSGHTHVTFSHGAAPAPAQRTQIALGNGWTVQSFAAGASSGVFGNARALTLLLGGIALSALLALLLLVLATGRRRALSLVREQTSELSHLALHDPLTGLPNRALVLDRAEQLLARTARSAAGGAAALYIDIDGFKHVNDNLGHAAGDQLLKVAGERLKLAVREQDTVGRLGGDEFIVLSETGPDGPSPGELADRITASLREPVELGEAGKLFSVTASIGVAAGRYARPDDLLRDADLALYAAKAAGKDRYALFDADLYAEAEGRLALQADLGTAVAERQLFLLYQPIFDLASKRVMGVEALVRWRHPQRGVVPPGSFIPLAEESRLIVPIGRWVLEEACRQAAAWHADGLALGISVNVSAYQLNRADFVEDVRHALARSGLEPSTLTLEITETTLVRDVPAARERLQEVKQLGVRVAIDDFGTGYASLSHLQRMPVDVLKIDRSFIAALEDGEQSRELLAAILGVGQSLSLRVVAEGIELHSQRALLEEMGCEMAQGFLLGHPGPADEIEQLLARSLPLVG
ncbi:MAG TPA: EAL domain-containing protein [Solirubrobacteraceae bacterium]|nr:EAL domain-containing protein [Solirubrobacteraceae bacterium]HUB74692.1 EAL domain-containing protein [Solirubrobacteraceae bacterium]